MTNRQRLLKFYFLQPFILTLRPGLIMSKTSDDSLLASRDVYRKNSSVSGWVGRKGGRESGPLVCGTRRVTFDKFIRSSRYADKRTLKPHIMEYSIHSSMYDDLWRHRMYHTFIQSICKTWSRLHYGANNTCLLWRLRDLMVTLDVPKMAFGVLPAA